MTTWKIVPMCDAQKLDIHSEDLLNGGHFRKCETYRGGGGYDQFPSICERRLKRRLHTQFVVQLYGCNLDCFFCYVTRQGVWNPWVPYTTEGLVKAFQVSGQEVFHLMGGAPAIYLNQWPELVRALPEGAVFHSDFLLTENDYDVGVLEDLSELRDRCLFAVDIKGIPDHDNLWKSKDYERNTRTPFKGRLFWKNLGMLFAFQVPFYLTFTNPDPTLIDWFRLELERTFGAALLVDSFVISLIEYDALPYVDNPPLSILI